MMISADPDCGESLNGGESVVVEFYPERSSPSGMDEAIGSTFFICKLRIGAFARAAYKGDQIAGPGFKN